MAGSNPSNVSLPAPFGPDLKVLVLAGSDPPASPSTRSARVQEVPLHDKSFVSLRGRLVIEYVLDQLHELGLTRIWLLAAADRLAKLPGRYRVTPVPQSQDADFTADLVVAARALDIRAGEPVLVVFGDHPVAAPNAVRDFLARCGRQLDSADFFHALALQAAYLEYGPAFRRTSVHTRDFRGRASGLTLVIPSRLHRLHALGELYGVRKLERIQSLLGLLWRLMRSLGVDAPRSVFDTLLAYAAKEMEKAASGNGRAARLAGRLEDWFAARVPVGRLERYAARILGAERGVRLIPVAHGGLAIDVDFAEELEVIERLWDAIQGVSSEQERRLLDPGQSNV